MFTRLRVENFKAWREQLWAEGIELAPVTILLGPNSAGKTSLLQVPLLLRQTFTSPDRTLDLNLGGQGDALLDLGRYEDTVHSHDPELELGFGLTVDLGGSVSQEHPSRFDYEVTYTLSSKVPVVRTLRYVEGDSVYGVERQAKGGYLLQAPGYEPRRIGRRLDARRSFQPERSLAFSADAVAELGPAGAHAQDLALAMRRAVERVAYLGPLREAPGRSYLWGGQRPGSLGPRGEQAIHALLASANSRKKRREGEEGGRGWLVEKVSGWLARMGIAEGLSLERQGGSRYFEVVVSTRGQCANITDVGFGVSQVLPMIVLAYFVPRGSVIVAEQPEIHLHPRAQVGLAELMVEVARERHVQFIVETHSEHLFRRLQFLIADEKLDPEECRLYFVEQGPSGRAELSRLEVDEFGRVTNWPEQFFGDAVGETERQMRRMMERLRARRQGGTRA